MEYFVLEEVRLSPSTRPFVSFFLILAFSPFISAQTEISGQLANGSFYSIAVPDGWTPADGLAVWNHGFDISPPGPDPDLGPLANLQLSEGYAVAASSYSLSGWAVFSSAEDMELLLNEFVVQVGTPELSGLPGRTTRPERQPLGSITLSTSGEGELQLGSLAAFSDQTLGATVRFLIPGIGIAGVGASGTFERAIVPVRLQGELNTGLAIRNAEVTPLESK